MMDIEQRPGNKGPQDGEQGYMLLGLVVAIFLILLALSVAASDMAQTIRRERERESARRADQYVRAIRLFYLKNGNRYPASVKQLENTNMIRFLRHQYTDPLTGKDYRLIPVGQNKTTPKGFFGQPLGGIASTGLGSAAGMQAPGTGTTATPGTSTTPGTDTTASATAASAAGSNPLGLSSPLGGGGSGLGTASGMASQTGTPGALGPFMGVGTDAKGNSILIVNEQTTYEMWEFLYDPRIEKLKAAAALNAGASSVGVNGLGQTPGTNPTSTTNPVGPSGGIGPTGGTNPIGGTSPTGP